MSKFNALTLVLNMGASISMLENHYAKFMNDDIYQILIKMDIQYCFWLGWLYNISKT